MNAENVNYTFKFGNIKFNVDVSKYFLTTTNTIAKGTYKDVLHYHAKHEMFFVDNEPTCIYTEDGCTQYNNCIVIIPPFLRHRAEQNMHQRFLISFEIKGGEKSGFAAFIKNLFSGSSIHTFNTSARLEEDLKFIGSIVSSPIDMAEDAACSTIGLILYKLYLDSKDYKSNEYSIKESYLMTIEHAINSYSLKPAYDLNLSTVADALHLSTKQTSRIIHKYFGRSFSELVTEKRLSVAKELLLNTNLSISDIARRCNFRSENYFYLTFKRAFGVTPSKYRRHLGNI